MFSHVMIGTNDLDKAKAFYDALLGTLDIRPARVDGHRIFYITKTGVFSVSKPINGQAATFANGGTIGFAANSPEQADAWHVRRQFAARRPRQGHGDQYPPDRRVLVNMTDEPLAQAMHESSGDFPPDIGEPDYLNLKVAPSTRIAAPRLADAPFAMECKTWKEIDVNGDRLLIMNFW